MPTDPLTASRYPNLGAAPNVPQDIQNAVFDLSDNGNIFATSTTDRDTKFANWVAAGGVMRDGLECFVSGLGKQIYLSGGWRNLTRATVRAADFTTGGVTSATAQTGLTSEAITVTALDVQEGRRIVVRVRGEFGTGTASPYVGAKLDGANLDPDQFEVQLAGATSWSFASAPIASAGSKTVTVFFRSHTGGTNVSAGNVKVLYEVI